MLACRSSGRTCARSRSRASRARSARCSHPACRSSTRSKSSRRPRATSSSRRARRASPSASARVRTWPSRWPRPRSSRPMVVQMIGVGEQTGALDQMLNKIADFYEEEVDVAVGRMTALIEPIMMVGIGGMVGVRADRDVPADLRHRRRHQGRVTRGLAAEPRRSRRRENTPWRSTKQGPTIIRWARRQDAPPQRCRCRTRSTRRSRCFHRARPR